MSLRAHLVCTRGGFSLDARFDAQAGETLALVGSNGTGKSTILGALAGLLPLRSGELVLYDRVLERTSEELRLPPQARDVGMMFQGLALFPHLSVLDNVAYGPRARGESREQAYVRARSLLRRFDVASLEDRKPDGLSGGEAQRVALARALAIEPKLLLLDEPLSAFDAAARGAARDLLAKALAELDGIKIVVTHDPTDAQILADRILVVEGGKVVEHGRSDQMLRESKVPLLRAMAANLEAERPRD